jgi:hypothetical protein
MTIEDSDNFASYLIPEIQTAHTEQIVIQKAIQYKQAGLDFVNACKLAATDSNGVIDDVILKEKITAAIVFLQTYHDSIDL